jgi:argininosuccinate lyase
MSGKLWSGRFVEQQSKLFDQFNASIEMDYFLAISDIKGSIAHAKGLHDLGVFTKSEWTTVTDTLHQIIVEVDSCELNPSSVDEDVHMWIERVLTERTGILGKKLHTARSRNDQVATATKIWLKDVVVEYKTELITLIEVLLKLASENSESIMPGLTHLQHAQPISLGFHLLSYIEMFKRDYVKLNHLEENLDTCPLGAGALAGTNYLMNRSLVAAELGFSKLAVHAMDAVSDRDYVLDYLNWTCTTMLHLSRLSEELILWNSPNFAYVLLSDAVTSGSSIMPNKKNPDACELIRGKTAVALGRLNAMQGILKGLPLAYNKDLQEDKKIMYHAYLDSIQSITMMTHILSGIKFNKEKMQKAVQLGFMNATDLADALVLKGVAFREAHKMVGKVVKLAESKGLALEELKLGDYQAIDPVFDLWVYEVVDYKRCMNNKKSIGSTSLESVTAMIVDTHSWLANYK